MIPNNSLSRERATLERVRPYVPVLLCSGGLNASSVEGRRSLGHLSSLKTVCCLNRGRFARVPTYYAAEPSCCLLPTGRTLKTPLASVHELSVHVHVRCAGTVHVHVRFVPENSCCTVVHGSRPFQR